MCDCPPCATAECCRDTASGPPPAGQATTHGTEIDSLYGLPLDEKADRKPWKARCRFDLALVDGGWSYATSA
jgi:hypothetical protein